MKFGDIIENTCAGRRNPLRVLIFLRHSGEFAKFVATTGEEVKFYSRDLQSKNWLVPTGKRVDFSEWQRLAQDATVDPMATEKVGE